MRQDQIDKLKQITTILKGETNWANYPWLALIGIAMISFTIRKI
jgi:hypothetical protein